MTLLEDLLRQRDAIAAEQDVVQTLHDRTQVLLELSERGRSLHKTATLTPQEARRAEVSLVTLLVDLLQAKALTQRGRYDAALELIIKSEHDMGELVTMLESTQPGGDDNGS